MSKFVLKNVTPESKEMSSNTVLKFLKTIDDYGLYLERTTKQI